MPILNSQNKLERVYLPSTKDASENDKAFVDMEVGPLLTADILGVKQSDGEMVIAAKMVTSRIKGWNYTDEAGNPLEVSVENVSRLATEDFTHLANLIPNDNAGLDVDEKKTSSPAL